MDELLELKKNAILGKISGKPLCKEYRAALRKCGDDKEMLVRLALMQQCTPYLSHACYEKMGLSKEYILANFDEYINGKRTFDNVEGVFGFTYQIYVSHDQDFDVTADVTTLMWCHDITLNIKESKCPTLYVSNNSDIHVTLEGCNSIRIYLFDESRVTIDDSDDTCDVLVYKYNNRATVEIGKYGLGDVKVFNKELRL